MQVNIIKLDETKFWTDEKFKEKIGRIFGIYLYDPRAGVHLCDMNVSRELHRVGSVVERMPDSEEEREELFDYIREASVGEETVTYMYGRDVDRLAELADNTVLEEGRCKFGDFGDDNPWDALDKVARSDPFFEREKKETWVASYHILDEAREYAQGNGFIDA